VKSKPIEDRIALVIPNAFGVLAAVEFDDQPPIERNEVGDVGLDRYLAPKFVSGEASVTEQAPELLLGLGALLAELAREALEASSSQFGRR